MIEKSISIVEGRSCDGCTMCCKLLSIDELEKPRLKWCVQCDVGVGCKIYDQRPSECHTFYCIYLLEGQIEEYWKPNKSKMVISYEGQFNRIAIYVDPFRKNVWRQEPYYSRIKEWAISGSENQVQVVVWQGEDVVVVMPDKEKNLGSVGEDQIILTSKKTGPLGPEWDAMVVDKDDPILKNRTDLTAMSDLQRKIENGELPFRAEVTSSDGSSSSMKVYNSSIVKDGQETILFDDEITLSTNAGEGDKTDESSASLTIPVQAMPEPSIATKGNASVTNANSIHEIELCGNQKKK